MLIETDCPYATPEPYSQERNDSSYLVYIIKRLAEIRKVEPDYIIKVTCENANRLFKIGTTTKK
jgi:TatD DNase family protein